MKIHYYAELLSACSHTHNTFFFMWYSSVTSLVNNPRRVYRKDRSILKHTRVLNNGVWHASTRCFLVAACVHAIYCLYTDQFDQSKRGCKKMTVARQSLFYNKAEATTSVLNYAPFLLKTQINLFWIFSMLPQILLILLGAEKEFWHQNGLCCISETMRQLVHIRYNSKILRMFYSTLSSTR